MISRGKSVPATASCEVPVALRAGAFDIVLQHVVDAGGRPGVRGKCDLVGVFRRARTNELALREVKVHVAEVLTEWMREGVLATELVTRRYCRAGEVARSKARCVALQNGAGDRLLGKLVRDLAYPVDCRIWTGATDRDYSRPQPKLALEGVAVSARRAVVELAYGPVPNGILVHNLCGHVLCLEAAHQGVRPQRWNVQRTGHPRGVFCGASRIDFNTAQQIRVNYQADPRRVRGGSGVSLDDLAKQNNISISAVRQILSGRTWRHPDEGGGA